MHRCASNELKHDRLIQAFKVTFSYNDNNNDNINYYNPLKILLNSNKPQMIIIAQVHKKTQVVRFK